VCRRAAGASAGAALGARPTALFLALAAVGLIAPLLPSAASAGGAGARSEAKPSEVRASGTAAVAQAAPSPAASPRPSAASAAAGGARSEAKPSEVLVFDGATLLPVASPPIENGRLVVEDGRIIALGPADRIEVPAGARVLDRSGRVILPGLVDTHSHLGLYPRPRVPANLDANELSGPLQPEMRALDAVWPGDPGIRMARAGGVTTANLMPGSGNPVGGQTLYVKLRGDTVEEMRIPETLGGMKMAGGENPKRVYGGRKKAPQTRMKVAALQRGLLIRAQEYAEKWQRHREKREDDEDAAPPKRDLGLEAMVEVLEGRRVVHYHTHRADDIATALRLREEFDLRMVLQHVTEGFRMADRIAAAEVPCSIILVDSPGGKHEIVDLGFSNAAALERAGVRVAIHTDDPVTSSRLFLRSAALAVRGGMTREGALRAVTLEGSRILGLADRVGSLEPGKDADLVVLSGDPFSVYTEVLETWIEGERVFDRSDPEDRRYAVGGFAAEPR